MSSTLAETFVDQLVMKKIYSLVGSRYFCCSKKKIREREREVSCHQLSSVKKGEKVLLKSDLRNLREMSSFSSLSHKRSDAKKQIQTVLTCPV